MSNPKAPLLPADPSARSLDVCFERFDQLIAEERQRRGKRTLVEQDPEVAKDELADDLPKEL